MAETTKAVFLSYAREDAGSARRIAEALRASGLEVWFDQNELVGRGSGCKRAGGTGGIRGPAKG